MTGSSTAAAPALPLLCSDAMLKGREWLAKPEMVG
jgi:hypothetical protein